MDLKKKFFKNNKFRFKTSFLFKRFMSSIDDQLASLEKTITGSLPSTISSTSPSFSNVSSSKGGYASWGVTSRLITSAIVSGLLMGLFRPIWIYSISYAGEEEMPRRKVLWIKAAGYWILLSILLFAVYHFIVSRFVNVLI
jgi:hypothetical protein